MTEAESLLAMLAAIYAYECAQWAPFDAAALSAPWAGRRRVCFPTSALGNRQGAWMWANPLPPLGSSALTQGWPVALSPEGAFAYSPRAINPTSTPDHTEEVVLWESCKSVRVANSAVLVNGQLFFTAATRLLALRLAHLMQRLKAASPERRAAIVERAIASRHDLCAIRRRERSYRERTRALHWCCNVLWVYFFVGGALLTWWEPMRRVWPILLLGLATLMIVAIDLFRRAFRRLYRRRRNEWRGHAAMMALSPMASIRSYDVVSREAFAAFEPLAAAAALCPPEELRKLARRVQGDRAYPLSPVEPLDPRGAAISAWFERRLDAHSEHLLVAAGLSPDDWSAPPQRDGDDCRTFCPRCETQFSLVAGACQPCGGAPLLPLA